MSSVVEAMLLRVAINRTHGVLEEKDKKIVELRPSTKVHIRSYSLANSKWKSSSTNNSRLRRRQEPIAHSSIKWLLRPVQVCMCLKEKGAVHGSYQDLRKTRVDQVEQLDLLIKAMLVILFLLHRRQQQAKFSRQVKLSKSRTHNPQPFIKNRFARCEAVVHMALTSYSGVANNQPSRRKTRFRQILKVWYLALDWLSKWCQSLILSVNCQVWSIRLHQVLAHKLEALAMDLLSGIMQVKI